MPRHGKAEADAVTPHWSPHHPPPPPPPDDPPLLELELLDPLLLDPLELGGDTPAANPLAAVVQAAPPPPPPERPPASPVHPPLVLDALDDDELDVQAL